MSVKHYVKKPVVIRAIQFTGSNHIRIVKEFTGATFHMGLIDESSGKNWLEVVTLEGKMRVSKGDYVIEGVRGECYPCKPDIFEETYEEVL